MGTNEVIIVNMLTVIASGFTGWLFGKKKQKAEVSILEAKGLNSIREFYEKLLQDNIVKLEYYIKLSEDNRKELHLLRQTVDKLVNDACLRKGCNTRIYYPEDLTNDILKEE